MKLSKILSQKKLQIKLVLLVVFFCVAAFVGSVGVHAALNNSFDYPGKTNSSPSDSRDPATYNGYYQSSYYKQGTYYNQGSYNTYKQSSYNTYSQGSYSSYSQSSYESLVSDNSYSQGSYFSCPSGFEVFQGNSCCPDQDYSVVDTNGSSKGGKVEQCSSSTTQNPSDNSNNSNGSNNSSCTVHGDTVAHGETYTFYTTPTVPYGSTCTAVSRTCVNGQFDGDSSTYEQCTVGTAPDISGMSIVVRPPLVRFGGEAEIVWDGGNAEACTVKGWLLDSSAISGTKMVSGVQGESIYTLTCVLGPNTQTATATLKVMPRLQET